MFRKLTRNYPVDIEMYTIKPDAMSQKWLHQMRNPTSTDTALRDAIEANQTLAQPSTREAA